MKPIRLAFLWHMHQPTYRLRGEHSTFMPWVRLHAIRSYYDMVEVLREFPEVHVTINIVPALFEQIKAYTEGKTDYFWDAAATPAAHLGDAERRFLFDHFFSAQPDKMIRRLPRYFDLFELRNRLRKELGAPLAAKRLTTEDYRDLKVLFDLAWFGFKAREDYPELRQLEEKGSGFSDEDAKTVQRVELDILKRLPGLYREGVQRGQVELSCSPYAHPILPLLVNTDAAKEAMPNAPLPAVFSRPEDARRQISDALSFMEREFGLRPAGMWPSEGSLSEDVHKLLCENGVKWAATDEYVLKRSQTVEDPDPHYLWISAVRPDGTILVFRDHDLSDRIGFTYSKMNAAEAAEDLLRTAEGRTQKIEYGCMTLIALDGENPWEHYDNAGADFLRALYRAAKAHPTIRFSSVGDVFCDCNTRRTFKRLHAGSWINADFGIWIGGPEKNRSWELLGRVRSELATALASESLSPEEREQAWASLRAAEGSDWFWWLDHQFDTMYISQFDEAFRGHLRQAYEALKLVPPEVLHFPIAAGERRADDRMTVVPFSKISPRIDGYEANFFEWIGAIRLAWRSARAASTMQSSRDPVQDLVFGFSDHGVFFFRIDPLENGHAEPFSRLELILSFKSATETRALSIKLDDKGKVSWVGGFNQYAPVIAAKKVFELSVPFGEIGLVAGQSASLIVTIKTPHGEGVSRTIDLHVPPFAALREGEQPR